MSSGTTHLAGNVVGLAVIGVTVWTVAPPLALDAWLLGAALGLLITPDFDIDHLTVTESALKQIPLFGVLFLQSWYGYAQVAKHRGLSHHPLLGTATRVGYSFLLALFWYTFIAGLVGFLGGHLPVPLPQGTADWVYLAQIYGAWWLQDLIHLALDL